MTLQSFLPVAGEMSTADGKVTVPGLTTDIAWRTSSASIEWDPSWSCLSSLRIVLKKTYFKHQEVKSAVDTVKTNGITGVFGHSVI